MSTDEVTTFSRLNKTSQPSSGFPFGRGISVPTPVWAHAQGVFNTTVSVFVIDT